MKNVNVKAVKVGAAALLLGALGFSPIALAAPKEGVSLEDLSKIVRDLEINRDGNKISFAGMLPARCANGAFVDYLGAKDGKHVVKIRMPACEKAFQAQDDDQMIEASKVLKEFQLKDESGKLVLRHLQEKDANSRERVKEEELKDSSGRLIAFLSSADARRQEEDKAIDKLAEKVARLCRSGDYVGIGQEIEKAKDLLGDVSELLDAALAGQKAKFTGDLAGAKNAAEAKSILEKYREAADANGWDADALNGKYAEKRFALIAASVEELQNNRELTSESLNKDLQSWKRELREMDRDLYKKNMGQFALHYGDLAVFEAKQKNFAASAEFYEMAKGFAPRDKALKFDAQLVKAYAEAFKACVKKNPEKMDSCEKKYANKSKEAADNIKDALEAKRDKSDDDNAEYLAYMEQYGASFGQGPTMYYFGYGQSHPYAPGALEQFKYEAFRNYQQEQMMRYYYGYGANGRSPAGGAGPLF